MHESSNWAERGSADGSVEIMPHIHRAFASHQARRSYTGRIPDPKPPVYKFSAASASDARSVYTARGRTVVVFASLYRLIHA